MRVSSSTLPRLSFTLVFSRSSAASSTSPALRPFFKTGDHRSFGLPPILGLSFTIGEHVQRPMGSSLPFQIKVNRQLLFSSPLYLENHNLIRTLPLDRCHTAPAPHPEDCGKRLAGLRRFQCCQIWESGPMWGSEWPLWPLWFCSHVGRTHGHKDLE